MAYFPYQMEGRSWTAKDLIAATGLGWYRLASVIQEFAPTSIEGFKLGARQQMARPLPRLKNASRHTKFNGRIVQERT